MSQTATSPAILDYPEPVSDNPELIRRIVRRLIPFLCLLYVVNYLDRTNVAMAKLQMLGDTGISEQAYGVGAGLFFLGYFLFEVPSNLILEKVGARIWLTRIMVTWGLISGAMMFVRGPQSFYALRFLLGLAEAGFFPGVIVYLTHWFPSRDRARALAYFFVATPIAQVVSPKISNALLKIGTDEVVNGVAVHRPEVLGLEGWQWVYIFWGIPAVVLGVVVFFMLKDRPRDAHWLSVEEREALEQELAREKALRRPGHRMTVLEALRHPKVLLLACAYFFIVTGSYGVEFFLPSILQQWYALKFDAITWLVILPPLLALFGQLFVGWNSDRLKERRLHAVTPILVGATALALAPFTRGHLFLTILCFMLAFAGFKSYLPAFWSLPSLFLTEAAAAGSIGLINSIGNLGGFLGPYVLGKVETVTGSVVGGIYFLCASMTVSATIILLIGLGRKETRD